MKAAIILLVFAALGGGVIYGAVRLGWLERSLPIASLPAQLPTETPEPSKLPPTETSSPVIPTTTMTPAPTDSPTFTPSPTPTPVITPTEPTATIALTATLSEQEIVVSAFAECGGQYSGSDRQSRIWATNQTIKNGYHTVESIRKLVDERCGGVSLTATASNAERPTVPRPTTTPAPAPTTRPAATPSPRPTATMSTPSRFNAAEMEAAIHQRINTYRQQQGQAKLDWDVQLARIARVHSEDMAKNDRYSHINSAGDGPNARARKAGYNCGNSLSIGVAENIHLLYGHTSTLAGRPYDYSTQEQMVEKFVADWIDSPGHRRNILGARYGKTGIGVAFGKAMGVENGIYVTQKFC